MRKKYEEKIHLLGKKSKAGLEFLNYLYRCPMVDSQIVADALSIDRSTASRLIEDFVRLGILHELTGNKRNCVFGFSEYVDLFA